MTDKKTTGREMAQQVLAAFRAHSDAKLEKAIGPVVDLLAELERRIDALERKVSK